MPKKPIGIFWDLDGTLLDTGGAGWPCMLRASGRVPKDSFQNFSGLTDYQILAKLAGNYRRSLLEKNVGVYLQCLAAVLLPGVVKPVESAIEAFDAPLGKGFRNLVVTGNHPDGARLKLASAGLIRIAETIPIFGSSINCVDRASVVRSALAMNSFEDILLVGDSLNDVETAHEVGARCIAVETGHHTRAELEQAGACRVLPRDYKSAELLVAIEELAGSISSTR